MRDMEDRELLFGWLKIWFSSALSFFREEKGFLLSVCIIILVAGSVWVTRETGISLSDMGVVLLREMGIVFYVFLALFLVCYFVESTKESFCLFKFEASWLLLLCCCVSCLFFFREEGWPAFSSCLVLTGMIGAGCMMLRCNKDVGLTQSPGKQKDHLYRSRLYRRTALRIRELAGKRREEGITIGICGNWGSGKTFFIREIIELLKISLPSSQGETSA